MESKPAVVTFSGRVRLRTLIIIHKNVFRHEDASDTYSVFHGQWGMPKWPESMVQRPDLLEKISTNSTKRVRLVGEIGAGKSLLALQHAHQAYQSGQVQSVIWFNVQGADVGYLRDQWLYLTAGLGLIGLGDGVHAVRKTYEKLLSFGKVLVVYDDVAEYEAIKPYMQFTDQNLSVLITTRNDIQWFYDPCDIQIPAYNHLEADGVDFKSGEVLFQIRSDPVAHKLFHLCAFLHPQTPIHLDELCVLFGDSEAQMDVLGAVMSLKEHSLFSCTEDESYYVSSIMKRMLTNNIPILKQLELITKTLNGLMCCLAINESPFLLVHCEAVMTAGLKCLQSCLAQNYGTNVRLFDLPRLRYRIEVPQGCSEKLAAWLTQYNQLMTGERQLLEGEVDLSKVFAQI